jgi:hypothetical protein
MAFFIITAVKTTNGTKHLQFNETLSEHGQSHTALLVMQAIVMTPHICDYGCEWAILLDLIPLLIYLLLLQVLNDIMGELCT